MTKKLTALFLVLALVSTLMLTAFADTVEDPTPSSELPGYYVVGTFSEWTLNADYRLTKNPELEDEEYLLEGLSLTTDDMFKVVYTSDGVRFADDDWFPQGMGNSYGENGEITENGTYTVYFRRDYDGGDDWFYGCIYVAAPEVEPTEPAPETSSPSFVKVTDVNQITEENIGTCSADEAKAWVLANWDTIMYTDTAGFVDVVFFDGINQLPYVYYIYPFTTKSSFESTNQGQTDSIGGLQLNYQNYGDDVYICEKAAPAAPTEEPTSPAEEPTEPIVGGSNFYIVGNFTDWSVDSAYKMTLNEEAETEEYTFNIDLTTESQFKVVYVDPETSEQTWLPDGFGNNYGENGEITADGNYDIYFRPNYDGGEDWYYNCIYVAAQSENEAEVIAAWSFDNEGKEAGAKLSEYGSKDGYAATIGTGTLTLSVDGANGRALEWSDEEYGETGDQIVPIMAAGSKNPWGAAPYIQVAVSSANYESITFTACMAGSNKAPAEWQLSYSTDGETFTDIEGASFTLSSEKRKILTAYLDDAQIPEDAEGAETLYLRLTATSTTTVAGGSTVDTPTGGEVAINNICVKATAVSGGESALLGDADGDGEVTILDVTAIQRFLVNLPNASFNEAAADTDGDGEVTILDATYIQRWLASLPVDFAIGEPING